MGEWYQTDCRYVVMKHSVADLFDFDQNRNVHISDAFIKKNCYVMTLLMNNCLNYHYKYYTIFLLVMLGVLYCM